MLEERRDEHERGESTHDLHKISNPLQLLLRGRVSAKRVKHIAQQEEKAGQDAANQEGSGPADPESHPLAGCAQTQEFARVYYLCRSATCGCGSRQFDLVGDLSDEDFVALFGRLSDLGLRGIKLLLTNTVRVGI